MAVLRHGVGASAEFGRHIELDEGYFVGPYAQVSSVIIQGKDYDLEMGYVLKVTARVHYWVSLALR